jgi:hypothetical protein
MLRCAQYDTYEIFCIPTQFLTREDRVRVRQALFDLLQYRFHKAALIEFFDNAAIGVILGL